MTPVDAYLADLRAALGDRLPAELKETRLREARGHLAASTQEVGEDQAVRRYGPPRVVAEGLVRAHRGYDRRSVWRLALPLAAAFLLFGASEIVAKVRFPRQHPDYLSAEALTALLFSLGFVLRVAQTRRWLAGPMVAAQAATIALLGVLANVRAQSVFMPEPHRADARRAFTTGRWSLGPPALRPLSRDEIEGLAWEVYDFGAFWVVLNAATLGLAALSDRRRAPHGDRPMTPVDAYLADLRAALGRRLPPDLKEARLRETRGHLLASAEEVGEEEAARRYGRPRIVANNLVRAHRRYDVRSVWHLALPIALTLALVSECFGLASTYLNDGMPIVPLPLGWGVLAAYILVFVARVVQTRRWLVVPMVFVGTAALALAVVVRHAYPVSFVSYHEDGAFVRRRMTPEELSATSRAIPIGGTPRVWLDETLYNAPGVARSAAIWFSLNAAALGLAALSDRRRVRRA